MWWSLVLAAVTLSLGSGCVEGAASSEQVPGSSNVAAAVASTTTNAPAVAAPEAGVPDITTADVKPVNAERPLPPTIRSNSPVADILKLADSGVDEAVLLAFVTNSTSIFNLTADEIIYLNDIGIPGTVMTTILEHDKVLRSANVTNVWASTPPPAPADTANPPPQEMAPQVAQQPPPAQESAAPPPSQVTYNNFYSSMSPYGTWVEVEGYGRCWQPTAVVVNPSWQPYMNSGRWVYTDYGWYWASDYSWGWAPFHYGRWFQHCRLGWCWYPDTVWGPSWVSWRYTDAYCGWAPLPPCAWYSPGIGLTYWGSHVGVGFTFGLTAGCYSYVSWNHFNAHHPCDYAVPYGHRQQIYNQSVAATRVSGTRNNVFNHGIPVEHVERATGSSVNRVAIHEVSTPRGGNVRLERLSSDGRSMTVYRPRVPEGNREMPAAVRERTQPAAGGAQVAGYGGTRPASVNRVAPSGSAVPREGTAANIPRPEMTRSDVVPQRPISAASLAAPVNQVRSPGTLNSGTSVVRTEPSSSGTAGRSRDGRSSTASPGRPDSITTPVRPASQPTSPVPRAEQNSRSVQRAEPAHPTGQKPQTGLPNVPASQPAAPVYRAPQPQAPQVPRYAPNSNPSYQQPSRPAPETPRASPPQPSYQSPPRSYTPSQPSYQTPKGASQDVPRYTQPAPQREYSAPAPAPAPAQSSPKSYNSQGSSGGGNNSGRSDRQSR